MKRLLIDVNSVVPYFVSGRVNGIGRTTLELVDALSKVKDLPFEIILYSQNMKGIGGKNMNLPFKCRHLYLPNRPPVNKFLSHFPVREIMTGYDLMHIPHNFEYVHHPEKCIVTIHDAMFFSYPEKFLGHDFARENYPKLAKKAKAIITCSENSKKEIIDYMQVPEEKIFVTPWGVNHDIFKPNITTPHDTIKNPFFLSVSCNIGRKNTIAVLEAYDHFFSENPKHDLVLVWGQAPIEIKEKYSDRKYRGKIHFLNRHLSDEQLAELYSAASATFFPSKYEGFGLPVLESMSCGTPVITAYNSSLPEVGGDAAIYVDPDDIEGICKWMETFENNSLDIESLKRKSIEQAAKFTWERCARQTIEVYKRCLEI